MYLGVVEAADLTFEHYRKGLSVARAATDSFYAGNRLAVGAAVTHMREKHGVG